MIPRNVYLPTVQFWNNSVTSSVVGIFIRDNRSFPCTLIKVRLANRGIIEFTDDLISMSTQNVDLFPLVRNQERDRRRQSCTLSVRFRPTKTCLRSMARSLPYGISVTYGSSKLASKYRNRLGCNAVSEVKVCSDPDLNKISHAYMKAYCSEILGTYLSDLQRPSAVSQSRNVCRSSQHKRQIARSRELRLSLAR